MLHVACCLWEPNRHSHDFSRIYDETWVERLYRAFKRNLTKPFKFICFTDRLRKFSEPVLQEMLLAKEPNYGCLIEPFRLNVPMMICGLDMLVLRNLDHMADYCLSGEKVALPIHPSRPDLGAINPIVFVPAGNRKVFDEWRGENDMDWLRTRETIYSDSLWPEQILSWKIHELRTNGDRGARIVYFHGRPKMDKLSKSFPWVKQAWR